jgi:GNAT superfamily N-acetyltransferase
MSEGAVVVLRDGGTVLVRPIRPEDGPALVRFHSDLSAESVYLRYFSPHPRLSDAEISFFTTVDYPWRLALVALLGDVIVGVARYEGKAGSLHAEVALVIQDLHQGRGIGTVLLEWLADAAGEAGLTEFYATTLRENQAMLSVFRDAGANSQFAPHSSEVTVRFPVPLRRVRPGPSALSQEAVRCHDAHMEVDRNGLEILDRDECLRLLASATLGRVGFSSGALPAVFPVNFDLDGQRILVRTGRGSGLDVALRDAVVAFEVDDLDPVGSAGWSVAVTGVATVVADPAERRSSQQEPAVRWAGAGEEAVFAISTALVSGRRTIPASLPPQR